MESETESIPFIVAKQDSSEPPPAPPKPEPYTCTIDDAFNIFAVPAGVDDTDFQAERAVRACSYLLHYCSEFGNESLDGWTAHGIATALHQIAEILAQKSRLRARTCQ